jgi:glucose/arabinose dehydrogenase
VAAWAGAQDAPDGAALFQQYCAQCHGATLQGGNAQSMVDGVWQFGEGRGYVERNIKHGITDLGMPAYEDTLSEAELKAVVAFVLTAEEQAAPVKPPPPSEIQTNDYVVSVEQWVQHLDMPWAMAFPDDHTAWITERSGSILVVRDGVVQAEPVAGTPTVLAKSQGGLMDIVLDPKFSENGWVYLSFSHASETAPDPEKPLAMTKVVRGKIRDNHWVDEQVVFQAPAETYLPTLFHYGCRIAFDKAGHLFFSIGERGMAEMAQDLTKPNGKIHRVWPDGRIPEDNPFVGTPGALPSIYAYGNRNPQGLAIHPHDDTLWETEHGPMGGDEVNVIESGLNYGWPTVSYGRDYSGTDIPNPSAEDGMAQAALFWRPSIAVCGIEFYTGEQFAKWNNNLLVTALRNEELRLLTVVENRVLHQESLLRSVGRVRDVAVGPGGAVYVITNGPGAVLKLTVKSARSY